MAFSSELIKYFPSLGTNNLHIGFRRPYTYMMWIFISPPSHCDRNVTSGKCYEYQNQQSHASDFLFLKSFLLFYLVHYWYEQGYPPSPSKYHNFEVILVTTSSIFALIYCIIYWRYPQHPYIHIFLIRGICRDDRYW